MGVGEILAYLHESVDGVEVPNEPEDPAGKKLYDIFDMRSRYLHLVQLIHFVTSLSDPA